MLNRTLAVLVVTDNETNTPETISIFVPFPRNNELQLNEYVNNFCLQKDITLVIPANYTAWQDRIIRRDSRLPPGEYDCEVCNQSCLQQGIDLENPTEITERFCSNFCSRIGTQENDETS